MNAYALIDLEVLVSKGEVVYLQRVLPGTNKTVLIAGGAEIVFGAEADDCVYEIMLRPREAGVNSPILSVRRFSLDWIPLQPTAMFAYTLPTDLQGGNGECVWRNETVRTWSTDGCQRTEDVCMCDHFTEFAVLSSGGSGSGNGITTQVFIISEAPSPFYAAIFGFVGILLLVCFSGNAMDGAGREAFMKKLSSPYSRFVVSHLDSDFMIYNRGCCSSWFCTSGRVARSFTSPLLKVLLKHRFVNWFTTFYHNYDRVYRLIVLGTCILTTGFFSGLLYDHLPQGDGWLVGFINAALYVPVVLLVENVGKLVGFWEFGWKYVGLWSEHLSRLDFHLRLSPDSVKKLLNTMTKKKSVLCSSGLITESAFSEKMEWLQKTLANELLARGAQLGWMDRLRYASKSRLNAGCMHWRPVRHPLSAVAVITFGAWFLWCAAYFIKFVFAESWDKAEFVVKSSGWCYILVISAVEPVMALVSVVLGRCSHATAALALVKSLEENLEHAANEVSLMRPVLTDPDEGVDEFTRAVRLLYLADRILKTKSDTTLIIDGSQVIRTSSEEDTNALY